MRVRVFGALRFTVHQACPRSNLGPAAYAAAFFELSSLNIVMAVRSSGVPGLALAAAAV